MDRASIPSRLELLARRAPAIFGADSHGFALNPVVTESEVERFEAEHGVRLPEDYRWFLTNVGNGGIGPHHGLHPLGTMDGASGDVVPWSDELVGPLSRPFPHSDAWNDLTGMPDFQRALGDDRFEADLDLFDERYWGAEQVEGSVPICHLGCALRIWLVVTGDELGRLWLDRRADREGLAPATNASGRRIGFLEWYDDWLTTALLAPPSP